MYPVSILLVCTILAELLYVILPFLLTFPQRMEIFCS